MRDQPILAHLDPLGEAALDHEPTERTLQPTEQEETEQPRPKAPRDTTADEEPEERRCEGDSDQPPPQPMQPFPEIDRLEVGDRHPRMHQAELRDLLVFCELGLPGGVAER